MWLICGYCFEAFYYFSCCFVSIVEVCDLMFLVGILSFGFYGFRVCYFFVIFQGV